MKKLIRLTGCFAITCLVLTSKLVAQVGVGTSTPTAGTKFEVVGAGTTSATTALRVRNSSSSTPLLMVRDDGNVGIGTTAPSAGLEIVTDGGSLNALRVATNQTYNTSPDVGIGFRFKFNTAGDYTSGAVISALKENNTDGNQSGSLRFWTTNSAGSTTEKMRITSEGNVGIGTITPRSLLSIGRTDAVNEGGQIDLYESTNNTVKWSFDVFKTSMTPTHALRIIEDGTTPRLQLDPGSTSWVSVSDARLKNVLNTWESDDQINFVEYQWKNDNSNKSLFGYLAQDVQKVFPAAVSESQDGMLAVDYTEVHSFKISNLERKNSDQEKRIKELEQTVDELKKVIKRKRFRRKA